MVETKVVTFRCPEPLKDRLDAEPNKTDAIIGALKTLFGEESDYEVSNNSNTNNNNQSREDLIVMFDLFQSNAQNLDIDEKTRDKIIDIMQRNEL